MNAISPRPMRLMLATLTLAAAAAVLPTADAAPRGGPDGMGPPPPMMMFGGPHLDRMLESIGATADQRSQVKAIFDAARIDLRTIHEAGRPLHEQLSAAFTQPTVDARTVEALRQQMLAQHDKASQRSMQAMLDASRVLSAEQRQAIAARMAEHRAAMAERRADKAPATK